MDNKNLFSIGEIAKAVGITRKTILNYEAKNLIRPDKKMGDNGNRYYTIDTFTQIRTIRLFQDLGLSFDEIGQYLNGTSDLQPMIQRLEAMKKYGTDTTRRMYFTEYSANAPQDVSYCVAVPSGTEGEYISIIPELKAISFFHHGAYNNIPETRKRLISYAEENNLKPTGVFRNIYLEGPPQHKDNSKFITQIVAIIE